MCIFYKRVLNILPNRNIVLWRYKINIVIKCFIESANQLKNTFLLYIIERYCNLIEMHTHTQNACYNTLKPPAFITAIILFR